MIEYSNKYIVGENNFIKKENPKTNIVIGSTTTFGTGEWYVSMPFTASNADGILMTANLLDNGTAWYNAVMNGARQSFSAVISISDIRHPSRLAWALQEASSRVLTAPGHQELARELQLKPENLINPPRLAAWKKNVREASFSSDTVGVLVWNGAELFAGTSTGGRGFEEPGRVSDSGTVAGTYASPFVAVSATGLGEEIVDDAVAARLETRVRDGMSLEQACLKALDEAKLLQRSYGWIACDAEGGFAVAYTTDVMSYLVIDWDGQILASSRR
jgi:L-asparaginase